MTLHSEPQTLTTLAAPMPGTNLQESVEHLWDQWRDNPSDSNAINELVAAYMYLVESGVQRVYSRIPKHVNRDELHAAALEALYFSLHNCNPEMRPSFEGYARKRIHGAIMDLLRCLDGVPRSSRRATRRLNTATLAFRDRHGREPCQEELAGELSLSKQELSHLEAQARTANRLSLDASMSGDASDDSQARSSILARLGVHDSPLERMIDAETRSELVSALEILPERYRAVLVLHYTEGIRFNEIAEAMGVSEARISQIHVAGLERLREHLVRNSNQQKS